jgi:mycothiol synthase
VLPAHRRRGLALTLLRHVFRHFARLGMKRVVLGVDGESPTGAVALYERAGMSVLRRNVTYERVSG